MSQESYFVCSACERPSIDEQYEDEAGEIVCEGCKEITQEDNHEIPEGYAEQ